MSDIIYHMHHIVPKHAGGTDDQSNLVKLTIEEHAEAHKQLFEKYGRWQDELAYKTLSGLIGKDEALAEIWKKNGERVGKLSKKGRYHPGHSDETKTKISKSLTGKTQSKETKEKRAAKHKGRKNSFETIEKMKAAAKNRKPISEETRQKMSEAAKKRHSTF